MTEKQGIFIMSCYCRVILPNKIYFPQQTDVEEILFLFIAALRADPIFV